MNSTGTSGRAGDVLIKVGNDGRLTIPRAIVQKQNSKTGRFRRRAKRRVGESPDESTNVAKVRRSSSARWFGVLIPD